jgi:hypothetical protein
MLKDIAGHIGLDCGVPPGPLGNHDGFKGQMINSAEKIALAEQIPL